LYILIFSFLYEMGRQIDFGLNDSKPSLNLIYSWFHHEHHSDLCHPQVFEFCYIFKQFICYPYTLVLSWVLMMRHDHILCFIRIHTDTFSLYFIIHTSNCIIFEIKVTDLNNEISILCHASIFCLNSHFLEKFDEVLPKSRSYCELIQIKLKSTLQPLVYIPQHYI
jgi:hypothetical protein